MGGKFSKSKLLGGQWWVCCTLFAWFVGERCEEEGGLQSLLEYPAPRVLLEKSNKRWYI